jgi:hypothetical protein
VRPKRTGSAALALGLLLVCVNFASDTIDDALGPGERR